MNPRIYLYKITFLNQPFWYWGVHKEKKFNEPYMGSPVTNKKYWDIHTPLKEIVKVFDYTDEGWGEAIQREREMILHDLDEPLCLNAGCVGHNSLKVNRDCVKEFWSHQENRVSHSEKMKEYWSLKENRDSQSRKMREVYKDSSGAREKMSQTSKDLWENEDHRKKMLDVHNSFVHFNPNKLTDGEIQRRTNLIKESEIDLQTFGWVGKVSKLLGISHTRVRVFFERHWKDDAPYKRKSKTP